LLKQSHHKEGCLSGEANEIIPQRGQTDQEHSDSREIHPEASHPIWRPQPFVGLDISSTGLDRLLEEAFGHIKAHWALYPLSDTFRDLIDEYLLGLKRISRIPDVSGDAMMLEKRGSGEDALFHAVL